MMTTNNWAQAQAFLRFHIRPGDRLLCAVSGGLDSMCLLDFTCRLAAEMAPKQDVTAAHFNHGLRGEAADRDEAFVRDYCAAHNIPLTVGRGDAGALARRENLSVEEAARVLRYAFLERAAGTEGCRWILTAHHAGDNAETVLLNLIRGTGLRGLTGIPPVRGPYLRPFLSLTREEIASYASCRGIPHVEDETNADPAAASRNLLRLRIMPLLEELNPRAAEHISRTAAQLRTIDQILEENAAARTACAEVRDGRVTLSADALSQAPEAVKPRMLLRLFDLLGVGRRDIGAVHLDAILAMLSPAGGEGRVSLPRGVTARSNGGRLILETRPQPLAEVRLLPGQPLRWGAYTLTLLDHPEGEGIALGEGAACEDRGIFVGPCVPGERLTLPGARGGRSVKRLCADRRISPEERDRLPAVYTGGKLAAVWRLGTDVEFLPEGKAVRFIKITTYREADGS